MLPNAILRLSFGMRLFQGSTFGSTATKPDKLTNPSAAASRTLATFCGVSHSHVQVCRNAVAESVAKRIIEAVREETHLGMLRLKLLVIQFAFDEAEMDVRVGRSSDVRHVFMSHVRLFLRRNDDQTKLLEIPVATAIIDSTAAENLCEVLHKRIGWLFGLVAPRVVFIQNSDRAASNVRLAGHFAAALPGANTSFIFNNCMMHMMFTALLQSIRHFDLISPLWSASGVLSRGHVMDKVFCEVL